MQWTIPLLLEKGYEVRGVDNFARYGQIERKRDYEFLIGDLTDSAFTEKATKGVGWSRSSRGFDLWSRRLSPVPGRHPGEGCYLTTECSVGDAEKRRSEYSLHQFFNGVRTLSFLSQ